MNLNYEAEKAIYGNDVEKLKEVLCKALEAGLEKDVEFKSSILSEVQFCTQKEIADEVNNFFNKDMMYIKKKEIQELVKNKEDKKVIEAINNGDVFLDYRATIYDTTLMQYIVEHGTNELIEELYVYPNAIDSLLDFSIVDINSVDGDGKSGFDLVLESNRISLLKHLVNDNHIKLHYSDIVNTIYKSDCFNFILAKVPESINYYFSHCVAYKDNFTALDILSKYRIDLNYSRYLRGNTLNVACTFGNIEIIKTLIENGANVNFADCIYKIHPFENIFYNHNLTILAKRRILKYLIQKGADVHYKDDKGNNIFFKLADSPSDFTEELFLANELGIEYCKNKDGLYPSDYIGEAKFYNIANKKALLDLENKLNINSNGIVV